MLEINKIYNQDCLDGMKYIEDKSIDMVITDPPFKLNKTTGSMTSSSMSEKWQGNLKAGDKKVNIINNIIFSEWLSEVYRILKNPSHFYVFVNDKNVQDMLNEAIKVGFKLHNILIWKKNNCTPNRWYMKNCEFILFFHKGKSFPINNKESSQFLNYKNTNGKDKLHPTQKPVELIKEIKHKIYNDNILKDDNFINTFGLFDENEEEKLLKEFNKPEYSELIEVFFTQYVIFKLPNDTENLMNKALFFTEITFNIFDSIEKNVCEP